MSRLFTAVACWPFEAGTRLACRWRGHRFDHPWDDRCARPFCTWRRR